MTGHIFISYSHENDRSYVERLATFLADGGVKAWFDREIVTGSRWADVIEERIESCAAFIVVMTAEARRSEWVSREIDQAQRRGKPIFPLLLNGERFFQLAEIQYEDVSGGRMPSFGYLAQLPVQRAAPTAEPEPGPEAVATPGGRFAEMTTFTGQLGRVSSLAFTPDGRSLLTLVSDTTVAFWDFTNPHSVLSLATAKTPSNRLGHMSISPDGNSLIAFTGSHVSMWNIRDRTSPALVATFANLWPRDDTSAQNSLMWSPDAQLLAIARGDGTIHLLRVEDSQRVVPAGVARKHDHWANSVSFHPSRRILASGGDDNMVRLWNIANPAAVLPLGTNSGHLDRVKSVAFSRDGNTVATASADGSARLLSVADPERVTVISSVSNRPHPLRLAVFSPDSRVLATAGEDAAVKLWDISDLSRPALAATLAHPRPVLGLAFHPRGVFMATVDDERAAHLWTI